MAFTEFLLGLGIFPHPAGLVGGHHAGQYSQQEGPAHRHQFSPIKGILVRIIQHGEGLSAKLIRVLSGTWQKGWFELLLGGLSIWK